MDLGEIRRGVVSMADTLYEMMELVEKGFMEHKTEFLSAAMDKERRINEMEKALTGQILDMSRSASSDKDRRTLSQWEQVVETLERMGDEAANLVERVEIKVAECLLFSDLGVTQFNETYDTAKKSVEMMRKMLEEGKGSPLKDKVIDNGFRAKELVERYRKEHSERLIKGACTPIAANMYFDMLDFAGNLARHASNVVKLF